MKARILAVLTAVMLALGLGAATAGPAAAAKKAPGQTTVTCHGQTVKFTLPKGAEMPASGAAVIKAVCAKR